MSESKGTLSAYIRLFVLLVVLVCFVFIIFNVESLGSIFIAIVGFGAIVLFHEFGHFVLAKLTDVNVQAFSIGYSPVLIGIKRTEKGYRIRILPLLFKSKESEDSEPGLTFTIGKKAKAGETEYRIGLIPFGGFVKMLGQDDTRVEQETDDPRSYSNKSVGARMAIIAAGVSFNIISAIIIFIVVFLIGINLIPPVVGEIIPDSPAERAGLVAGDEIIEINGKSYNLDFMDIFEVAALSGKDEQVELKVKRRSGLIEGFKLVSERLPGQKFKGFGIVSASSLIVAELSDSDAEELFVKTGLKPGDKIRSINEVDVDDYFEFAEELERCFLPHAALLIERKNPETDKIELVELKLDLELSFGSIGVEDENKLGHIFSLVPRMKINYVSEEVVYKGTEKLQPGDIITSIGKVDNPTYAEMRSVSRSHLDEPLAVKVLRTEVDGIEQVHTVQVVPKQIDERVVIGITVVLDRHPVVAKTIETQGGIEKLNVPRGARITAVNKEKISNFYDVIEQLSKNRNRDVTISWVSVDSKVGSVKVNVSDSNDFITVKSTLSEIVPFKPLERVYKADNPIDAVKIGCYQTIGFTKHAILTLRGFVAGQVSAKNFMGPLGIIKISYDIVKSQPLIYYAYILGLLNAFIAVLNSLPLLPFDGGHIVFLAIEKIKGSPVDKQIQEKAVYFGLVLVLALAIYVTFNDVIRIFTGFSF